MSAIGRLIVDAGGQALVIVVIKIVGDASLGADQVDKDRSPPRSGLTSKLSIGGCVQKVRCKAVIICPAGIVVITLTFYRWEAVFYDVR